MIFDDNSYVDGTLLLLSLFVAGNGMSK
uniref:Uncharacterized protein n=1 Tax=Rhizophora mucronata TaxID=61149 RepID=A0A2P2QW12_RHIMU